MMLERPRGPSPWAPAPMARESFRTAASFDVDVDADDRLRRETPVPVRCCGCCFTRAKVKGTWCCMAHTAAQRQDVRAISPLTPAASAP